ncbi:MAG: hypothetical protein ACREYE_01480 [Gammaproteobacteria bacterium]
MKKSTALGTSRSGGARDPHVFHYTLRLLVSSLRLAPPGFTRRFAPGETLLRSGGTRLSFARDDFFTSSQLSGGSVFFPRFFVCIPLVQVIQAFIPFVYGYFSKSGSTL